MFLEALCVNEAFNFRLVTAFVRASSVEVDILKVVRITQPS
jgi:hypothetical protein